MRIKKLALALAATGFMAQAYAAGTLIYCSEGSPAGFDPAQYTTGTDFDASAETVFNRLSQFERGSTKVVPGLAENGILRRTVWLIPSICARA